MSLFPKKKKEKKWSILLKTSRFSYRVL